MRTEFVWQIFTALVCLRLIIRAWSLGKRAGNVGAYAWLIILPAAITIVYYTVAALTDWNETDPESFIAWGAAIRLITFVMIDASVERMRRRLGLG